MTNEQIEGIDPSPEYVKGFNLGYQIAIHEPETFKKILGDAVEQGNDYLNGVKAGKKQHEKEIVMEQLKQSQQTNRSKDRD